MNIIHFFMFDVNSLAKAESFLDLQQVKNELWQGTAAVEDGIRDLKQVIWAEWRRIPWPALSFLKL